MQSRGVAVEGERCTARVEEANLGGKKAGGIMLHPLIGRVPSRWDRKLTGQ